VFVVGVPALIVGLVIDGLGYQFGVYVAVAIVLVGLVLITALPVLSAFADLVHWFNRRRAQS
jgi:fucose permease